MILSIVYGRAELRGGSKSLLEMTDDRRPKTAKPVVDGQRSTVVDLFQCSAYSGPPSHRISAIPTLNPFDNLRAGPFDGLRAGVEL
jgi:hypothetical protein